MTILKAALWASAVMTLSAAQPGPSMARPKAGPVALMKAADVRPGMQAVAWTVFEGSTPEAVPVEIIGTWKNGWGPRQDVILGKMGGRAARTNVAGGMSGSPVYVDGKLIGAVALRLSVFSPDAICGITPIEYMLEINEMDASRPPDAKAPGQPRTNSDASPAQVGAAPMMVPIEAPISFAGFHDTTLREFRPIFDQMGLTLVQGGAAGSVQGSQPAPGWQNALQPGEMFAGVLVSGDMSVSGLCTVTYNDGRRVLGCGHSFLNLGPVNMPMAKGDVVTVLSSAFQPNKMANATEIAGVLRQDRHSAIMGVLGEAAETIPVSIDIRSHGLDSKPPQTRQYNFQVIVHQKYTPLLMMVTVFNTLQGINEFADETTYRLNGMVELEGGRKLNLSTMFTSSEMPAPPSLQLASWLSDKFNKLYLNPMETPKLRRVNATIDLLPERRLSVIEGAWLDSSEVAPGGLLRGKFALRTYRGGRLTRDFEVQLPENLAPGDQRLLISDADTLNRFQSLAGQMNRGLNVQQTVALLSQERTNDKVYLSLVESRPTVYADEKVLPGLPASVLNAMQASRAAGKSVVAAPETAREQKSIALDQVVSGSATLRFKVK